MTRDQIILGCKKGEQQAFKALVNTYSSQLMGICFRYMNSEPEAKDALQETYIRIFKSISNIDENGNFEGWMRRIAVNECLKLIKKRIPTDSITNERDYSNHMVEPEIEHDLGARDLIKVINQLPDHYKLIFNLYEVEGYSHKEIASMIDIGESSCRTKLMRAKNMLKELLEKKRVRIPVNSKTA